MKKNHKYTYIGLRVLRSHGSEAMNTPRCQLAVAVLNGCHYLGARRPLALVGQNVYVEVVSRQNLEQVLESGIHVAHKPPALVCYVEMYCPDDGIILVF